MQSFGQEARRRRDGQQEAEARERPGNQRRTAGGERRRIKFARILKLRRNQQDQEKIERDQNHHPSGQMQRPEREDFARGLKTEQKYEVGEKEERRDQPGKHGRGLRQQHAGEGADQKDRRRADRAGDCQQQPAPGIERAEGCVFAAAQQPDAPGQQSGAEQQVNGGARLQEGHGVARETEEIEALQHEEGRAEKQQIQAPGDGQEKRPSERGGRDREEVIFSDRRLEGENAQRQRQTHGNADQFRGHISVAVLLRLLKS
ncbi:hypothetical protein SDC9_84598 [bioreactor metagenome]|uniref:Uncharacterized protein n=1 Tax=bioreactor metagenome TaxID=1076179 RepID=A0A644ZAR1_9ZZZZ